MILLIDIGNTHIHLGIGNAERVIDTTDIATHGPTIAELKEKLQGLCKLPPTAAVVCSVVPDRTSAVQIALRQCFDLFATELNHSTVKGVGVDYPHPETIGPDRLANAIAAKARLGTPTVVVDFGTAVTFDVVNRRGNYVGGIIAPGIAAMTDYLHEKTALLPRIQIVEPEKVIGFSTEAAMLSGAVHGYRGLVRELLHKLKEELDVAELNVLATGGYADLIAKDLSEIQSVDPHITLDGLRRFHLCES
ncbi:MAG: type III pantothenate kinase [Limisphaerales bacterium]